MSRVCRYVKTLCGLGSRNSYLGLWRSVGLGLNGVVACGSKIRFLDEGTPYNKSINK